MSETAWPASYADTRGYGIHVEPVNVTADPPRAPGAFIVAADGVDLAPHQVAPFCRDVYKAAGLPVPELPDIPDPAVVEALKADLIAAARDGGRSPFYQRMAEELVTAGWRKDGAP